MQDNKIGSEGAKALAANKIIKKLNLCINKIGPEGAKALAANSTITKLNLKHNKIGPEGAKAFAANTTITRLNLEYNKIGSEGKKALAETNPHKRAEYGRQAGIPGVPSLLRLSLFYIKENSLYFKDKLPSNVTGVQLLPALIERKMPDNLIEIMPDELIDKIARPKI